MTEQNSLGLLAENLARRGAPSSGSSSKQEAVLRPRSSRSGAEPGSMMSQRAGDVRGGSASGGGSARVCPSAPSSPAISINPDQSERASRSWLIHDVIQVRTSLHASTHFGVHGISVFNLGVFFLVIKSQRFQTSSMLYQINKINPKNMRL